LFVDAYSDTLYFYFLNHKGEALEKGIKAFETQVCIPSGWDSVRLVCDNAKEFRDQRVIDYCNVSMRFTPHFNSTYQPQYRGRVEIKNKHVMEYIRTICNGTLVPHNMWQELCDTYAYLHSLTPRPHKQYITPYQSLCGNPPDLSHVRAVGSLCSLHDARPNLSAFQVRGIDCVLIGFDNLSSSTYRVMNLSTHEVVASRHIILFWSPFGGHVRILRAPWQNAHHSAIG
jgi:hypothetical protein